MTDDLSLKPDSILVAEDNVDDIRLLQQVFKRARILNSIQVVHDGATAIEYLRGDGVFGNRELHPYPILFLLDLKMPRKGGMDVMRWLADNPPPQPLPVVITAGAGEMREVNCAYSLGARSFLIKPLTWLDVMELLSCFRELRMAAQGENYVLEPVPTGRRKPAAEKPDLCGYKPQPLDTSRLKLTDDILRLTELLAENNHEVWARDRMAQGWTYGPKRDDERKQHPCLLPYRQLPESEKLLDRNVALETIKTIFSFGLPYPVLEKATDCVRTDVVEQTTAALKKRDASSNVLRKIWEEHNALVWGQKVEIYREAMAAALRCGEAFLALDIGAEGLKKYDADLHLQQMQALALAQTGAIENATNILEKLRSVAAEDEETILMLARTYRQLWMWAGDTGPKRRHLKLSFELYAQAFGRRRRYQTGADAAVTALLYGERETALDIARDVVAICRGLLGRPEAENAHSVQIALAEALLVQGDVEGAAEAYRIAGRSAGVDARIVSEVRSRARLLLERLGAPRKQLDGCFELPRIVVCAGDMYDKPERRQTRFPFGLEARVREEIRRKLDELGAGIGFSSLACGGEMLFAETMLERGGEIHVILPCNRQQFKAAEVDIIPGANLGERFEEILAKAASITILDETCDGTDATIPEYCKRIVAGKALVMGRLLGLDVVPLAVRNEDGASSESSRRHFVGLPDWSETTIEVISIDKILEQMADEDIFFRQRQVAESKLLSCEQQHASESVQEIKAVLFADIIGHSRLAGEEFPKFVQHFLVGVSGALAKMPNPPLVRNTWGETMHCVFENVSDAAAFALALQDLAHETNWVELGLPCSLNVRITLHAGPVYPCLDPVSGKPTFLGAHVNRATRIEPIAEEGQIYATEAFAALSEVSGAKEYACDYIGQRQIPRQYGTVPVFMVRHAR